MQLPGGSVRVLARTAGGCGDLCTWKVPSKAWAIPLNNIFLAQSWELSHTEHKGLMCHLNVT